MDVKSVIASLAVSLSGFFGCSKGAAPAAKATTTAQSTVKDLGIVQMTNNYETCVSIGGGKDCRMIPKLLDRKNIQITVTLESKLPGGKTAGLSVLQLQGSNQKPFEVSVGTNTDFTFIAQVAP
ncbi:MAG TPA: hypothetical protein VH280_03110 [Verrucomicrobiae bacterium]|nr:hypothetical protein [Verrucomicrobiae bacterium]